MLACSHGHHAWLWEWKQKGNLPSRPSSSYSRSLSHWFGIPNSIIWSSEISHSNKEIWSSYDSKHQQQYETTISEQLKVSNQQPRGPETMSNLEVHKAVTSRIFQPPRGPYHHLEVLQTATSKSQTQPIWDCNNSKNPTDQSPMHKASRQLTWSSK